MAALLYALGVLVVAAIAAHEGYRLGEHRGYIAGKRDGWNAFAAKLQERDHSNREIADRSTQLLQSRRWRGQSP
jgi:hypothetical protein